MSQVCNQSDIVMPGRVGIGVAVLGCVLSGLSPAHLVARPLSDWRPAQAFPVSDVVAKKPTPLPSFASERVLDPGGLHVPELDEPVMTYSDLLWTKEDYRAWISGTAFRDGQADSANGVFPVSFLAEPVAPPAGAIAQWNLGDRNWQYAVDQGLDFTLGNTHIGTSTLANTATLGGIQIRHSTLAHNNHDAADWKISMAIGALDYSDSTAKGDLSYGPTAANTVIQYGLGDHAAFESEVQVAPDLVTTTFGGRFDTGRWGQLQAGIAHGGLADQRGWRYQTAYDVEVMDDLRVSILNEWDAAGFADLAHYRGGVAPGVRSNLRATVPTRRWGDISGTYESFRPEDGVGTQRFGFSQQFWYSPNLRIGLHAQREVISGDYDIGLRFSVPIY